MREPGGGGLAITAPVAVVMSRFPVVTETFILRELDELERQGVPVVLVPLLREEPRTVHEQAKAWVGRALFTPAIDGRIARDVAHELLRRPLATLRLFARCAWDARTSFNALAGVVAFFPKSVSLGRRLRELGVAHVHAHFATHPGLAALVMARCGGDAALPFSMTVHAHDIFVSQAGLRTKVAASAFTRCISAFNARFLADRLGAAAAPPDKLPVIHCGIEPALYAARPRPPRPAGAPLRLLCIAALKPYKGVAVLVEAVRLARAGGLDVACRVIGGGPLRDELQERVAAAGLAASFELLGTRTQDEVASELAACDVFVLPSIVAADGQMEGIPVALMEALAAGLPVIATRLSGIPELVRPGETGFLAEPGDAAGLARAIREVGEDLPAASALAARGARLVASEFELSGVVAQLAARMDAEGAAVTDPRARALASDALRAMGSQAQRVGVARLTRGPDAEVAELLVARPDGGSHRVVAKRHLERGGASAPAAARARREHDALVSLRAEGLSVPRVIGLDDSSAVVVTERASGHSAAPAFRRARRDGTEALSIAGAAWFWLSQLREAAGPPRDAAAFTPEAVVSRLRRDLREDADACIARGLPQGLVRRLRLRAHRDLPEAVPRETCWTHGDFWPGNVLAEWSPDWEIARITVIDLEGMQPGLPLEDAANFLEHVALALPSLLSLSRLDRAREEIESVLLVGHGAQATIPQALRVAKALRLAARAPGLLRGPRRSRALLKARIVARLLELA